MESRQLPAGCALPLHATTWTPVGAGVTIVTFPTKWQVGRSALRAEHSTKNNGPVVNVTGWGDAPPPESRRACPGPRARARRGRHSAGSWRGCSRSRRAARAAPRLTRHQVDNCQSGAAPRSRSTSCGTTPTRCRPGPRHRTVHALPGVPRCGRWPPPVYDRRPRAVRRAGRLPTGTCGRHSLVRPTPTPLRWAGRRCDPMRRTASGRTSLRRTSSRRQRAGRRGRSRR